MTTNYDRELREETDTLDQVVAHVDNQIEEIRILLPATAAHQETAEKLQRMNLARLKELEEARPRPFFGRVDFTREEQRASNESRYLGIHGVEDCVTDWTAPVASLYFNPARKGYFVRNANGVLDARRATVSLKRTYTIDNSVLYEFSDVLRLAEGAVAKSLAMGDATLTRALEETGGSALDEAVATIQPDQYEQIASTDQPVMIIQGAAGSGKSLVGLHRIAYLLSPHNETQAQPRPENVVMLGPSRAFLNYTRALLPSLGKHDIRQITVNDWMLSQFIKRPRVDLQQRILSRLMGNRHLLTEKEVRAELFKGSMTMASLLDAYVKGLRKTVTSGVHVRRAQSPAGSICIDPAMIIRLIRGTADMPLNMARETFIARSMLELWAREHPTGNPAEFRNFEAPIRKSIEEQIGDSWPEFDPVELYLRFIGDSNILVNLGKGAIDTELAESLRASLPRLGQGFQSTDIPALLYLDHLLNQHRSPEFEHVVIDEAQEVSPLAFRLLQLHSRNGWFTILGDLRQRTLPYKGLDSWQDLRSVFGSQYSSPLVSRLSYRSTAEITRFANRILRRIQGNTPPPIPYSRLGARPKLHRSPSNNQMHGAISVKVRESLAQGMTIAVMTRTMFDARRLTEQLHRLGIEAVLLTPEGEIEGNLTVSPILLTKGLEFDVVIVAGVDADSFTGSDMDNRLLYLACTRARHSLEIHWSGTRSPLIAELGASGMELGGELEGRKSKRSIFRRGPRQGPIF